MFAPNDDAFVATCKALKVSKLELLNMPNLADILKARGRRNLRVRPRFYHVSYKQLVNSTTLWLARS